MEYLALYRKYRPKELDEVVGQSEIKKILASSVKNGTITHAYLFSGPRGTGKTTMAKILAKMVNCINPVDGNACGKCESCLNILNSSDVIEIDAASNNGVDEIRDLREKANLVPSSAKYKVYIIDEVHMLTTQAFNALLKTLEEPPKHVIFVLATTEYYKIPLTITSRCQKFQFSKLSNDAIVGRLKEIAHLEKIEIEDDALDEISKISDGGMRDSINFLDQLRSFTSDKITIDDVYEVCGNVSVNEIVDLLKNIRINNYEFVVDFFENIDRLGKNYGKLLENIAEFLKDCLLYMKSVNCKYIKNNVEIIKEINAIYSDYEIVNLIESINNLIDKLKNVSRQSVFVMNSFLIIMNKFNLNNDVKNENDVSVKSSVDSDNNYDMAFQFTNNDVSDDSNFTDNYENTIVEEKNEKKANDSLSVLKNKEIIINNTFALADKKVKNDLQKMLLKVTDYLTDKKYKVAAGSLADIALEVAGKGYVILSAKSDAVVEKIYSNYVLCFELLNVIFEGEYNYVILNEEEWKKVRDDYINNFKNGKKYTLKKLISDDFAIINEKKEATIVDKLFDLVGEDVVEFK